MEKTIQTTKKNYANERSKESQYQTKTKKKRQEQKGEENEGKLNAGNLRPRR